jgi:hypothetical protein
VEYGAIFKGQNRFHQECRRVSKFTVEAKKKARAGHATTDLRQISCESPFFHSSWHIWVFGFVFVGKFYKIKRNDLQLNELLNFEFGFVWQFSPFRTALQTRSKKLKR